MKKGAQRPCERSSVLLFCCGVTSYYPKCPPFFCNRMFTIIYKGLSEPRRMKISAKFFEKTVAIFRDSSYKNMRETELGKEIYAKRKETIERVFADAKEKHSMRYSHHRGLARVTNWVKLKFAAMNLKKLANRSWNSSD